MDFSWESWTSPCSPDSNRHFGFPSSRCSSEVLTIVLFLSPGDPREYSQFEFSFHQVIPWSTRTHKCRFPASRLSGGVLTVFVFLHPGGPGSTHNFCFPASCISWGVLPFSFSFLLYLQGSTNNFRFPSSCISRGVLTIFVFLPPVFPGEYSHLFIFLHISLIS